MDPSAATSAAGGHGHGHGHGQVQGQGYGHLITATRRRLLAPSKCSSSSRPASDQKVDPLDSASVSVSPPFPSASDPDPDPDPDPTAALGDLLVVCPSSSPTSTALAATRHHDAPSSCLSPPCLEALPSEMLTLVVGFLDVDDVFHLSRTCHRLRSLCLDPIIHLYRLRDARLALGSLLASPSRPTLGDLIARYIFQTKNTVISRRLARSLVSIRLSRRLAQRPSAESLVQRAVLPRECVPGMSPVLVAPALVAKRKAIEKERLKDGLRRWIAGKWKGEVKEREEDAKRYDEAHGIGRVWRLRRFWEKVSRGEMAAR